MITDALTIIGGSTIIVVLAIAIMIATNDIKELIKRKKRDYQVKPMFDKPPKAKCYCVDCYYYEPYEAAGSTKGVCLFSDNRAFDDTHFCAMAEPAKNSRR